MSTLSAMPTIKFAELAESAKDGNVHVRPMKGGGSFQNWSIPPHRHCDMYQLLLIIRGRSEVRIDGDAVRCVAPWLIWLPPYAVHSFQLSLDFEGFLLTLSSDYLLAIAGDRRRPIGDGEIFEITHSRAVLQELLNSLNLASYVGILCSELGNAAPETQEVIESLSRLILISVVRICSEHGQSRPKVDANRKIFQSFRHALEKHYREHVSIRDYARMLCIPEQRLHTACKAAAHRPPQVILHDRLMLEAQREILYTSLTIAEIAFDLGFEDPAYFSRFFAKRAGSSPFAYRRQGAKLTS